MSIFDPDKLYLGNMYVIIQTCFLLLLHLPTCLRQSPLRVLATVTISPVTRYPSPVFDSQTIQIIFDHVRPRNRHHLNESFMPRRSSSLTVSLYSSLWNTYSARLPLARRSQVGPQIRLHTSVSDVLNRLSECSIVARASQPIVVVHGDSEQIRTGEPGTIRPVKSTKVVIGFVNSSKETVDKTTRVSP